MHLGSVSFSCSSICDVLDNRHWGLGPMTLLMAVQVVVPARESVSDARGLPGSCEDRSRRRCPDPTSWNPTNLIRSCSRPRVWICGRYSTLALGVRLDCQREYERK